MITRRLHLREFPCPVAFLTVRLRAKAWGVPARITFEDDGRIECEIDGAVHGPFTEDALTDFIGINPEHPVAKAIVWGQFCDEAVYAHRLALKRWAMDHQPDHPALSPMKPIDPRALEASDF